ncbi:peptidoglycan hydrolase RipC [Mycobacterium sp.]|uniref:peptidoglycan hydrolase RipC n=1 Tax=Mycobacterium sp. TaxID=1785 RepID=UPI003A89739A
MSVDGSLRKQILNLESLRSIARATKRSALCSLASLTVLSGVSAVALADPAQDTLAKLNELSRQAEQTTEAMHSAQLDLNEKLAAQQAADQKLADDQAALEAAKARLATFQTAVNKVAAATYMGGRTDSLDAMLTAESPQRLIDGLSVQRVMARQMSTQMAGFKVAGVEAAKAEEVSAQSAAEAKSVAEQAAAVRAGLQRKQSQLQVQIAVVKSQYLALTAEQRTALADPGQVPDEGAVQTLAAPDPMLPWMPPEPAGIAGGPFDGPGFGGDRDAVVQAALAQIGTPYVWGGAAPGGFDCSGLVMWAFQQAGISLPHSSQALAHGGQPVSLSDLQPGDVLTFYSDASHAGIYIGDGMMVHSSTFGQPVRVAPMDASGPIYDARRY